MLRMLVTGGAGFIGANFVRYTLRHHVEHRVRVLDELDAYKNLAASTKRVIEAALLAFITTYRSSQDSRLCLAGGVAENSVAVGPSPQPACSTTSTWCIPSR